MTGGLAVGGTPRPARRPQGRMDPCDRPADEASPYWGLPALYLAAMKSRYAEIDFAPVIRS
jgi:hypothetical protein